LKTGEKMLNDNSRKNEEEGIKALAKALRNGGTLLNIGCPVCSYPLIRINDKIYCKVCNSEVLIYKDEKDLPKEIRQALKKETPQKEDTHSAIKQSLEKKIENLRKRLDESDDPDEIMKLSKTIDKLLETLEKVD